MNRKHEPGDTWEQFKESGFGLRDPVFYDLNERMLLIVHSAAPNVLGRTLVDKQECRYRIHAHEKTPKRPVLQLKSKVLLRVEPGTMECSTCNTCFELEKAFGRIWIFKEVHDTGKLDMAVLGASRDVEMLLEDDFWTSGPYEEQVNVIGIVGTLMEGLYCENHRTRTLAAYALCDLFEHIDHGCYGQAAGYALRNAGEKISKGNPDETDETAREALRNAIYTFKRMKAAGYFNWRNTMLGSMSVTPLWFYEP